jgi:hypothetical protein
MNEQRLGVETGFWQKAQRNDTPSVSVIRSRFGVTAAGLPAWPRTSPRHWSGLKITMLGRALIGEFLLVPCPYLHGAACRKTVAFQAYERTGAITVEVFLLDTSRRPTHDVHPVNGKGRGLK